jgi:hypothetical protein
MRRFQRGAFADCSPHGRRRRWCACAPHPE